MFPYINAIFYAEFHPKQGPKVLFEVPEGFFESASGTNLKVDFDSFSEYMIPKSSLCNRLVTISTTNYRIMGFPVSIQNTNYERNALLFNLCFVFDKTASIISYEQVVSKIARVLKSLEVESEFLSNASTKATLLNIIAQIMEDLNAYHECQILINDANTLDLKLFPHHQFPLPVFDYQVPLPLAPLSKFCDRHWDLTIQKILPFVNGVNSIDRISTMADVDSVYTRLAVQHLLYYGAVRLIDIFQFGNVYACTSGINELINSEELQISCIAFSSKKGMQPPSIGVLCSLYCLLQGSFTILDWIREHPQFTSQIDIRRFIAFGVIHKILLRIHCYPYLYMVPEKDCVPSHIARILDGTHHLDDLCTRFHLSKKNMLDMLSDSNAHCNLIWR